MPQLIASLNASGAMFLIFLIVDRAAKHDNTVLLVTRSVY